MIRQLKKSNVFVLLVPFLVLTLLMPLDLMARTKGVKIKVHRLNEQVVKGRVLRVDLKEGWVAVKPKDELTAVKIHMNDIQHIIVKKGSMGKDVMRGFLSGVVFGLALGLIGLNSEDGFSAVGLIIFPSLFGTAGLGIGVIAGAANSWGGKKIIFYGKTKENKMKILKDLKRKAMIID
jgi:hypothetical protein